VVYKFDYIPSGLFNRIQVRLFNYADTSTIWKNGSLLKKNSHMALINQSKSPDITVRVQGSKPQNIIFLIHEVIDTLISEYFHGIKYDYSFPCPECVDAQASDPCLFSASLLRRASELKAPYLQCHKYFHAISIQEMLSMMPIDGLSSLDLSLEYSLRDLKEIKKVGIFTNFSN
jgi:leucine-rich repeat kinase 2